MLEKQLKDFQSKTFPDFAQTAAIGDPPIQVIADEPAMRQVLTVSINWRSERIPSNLKSKTGL
jgi:hypothetical protein